VEAPHGALRPLLAPFGRVDVAVGAERRDELVAMVGVAVGRFAGAGEFEADRLQHAGRLPWLVGGWMSVAGVGDRERTQRGAPSVW
jgi:hypothetical protein